MSDEEVRIVKATERYEAAAHAMQSGVTFELEYDSKSGTPKHLRVGVNSAMVNDDAVARLLIAKGVFTEVEYHEAVADAMDREVKRYEESLTLRLGRPVTLR